jgi:hypothetical protein
MKSNPGGQLPVDEILGRDHLIAELWDILERNSVVMTAERRIGKTSIIRKMHAHPENGWIPVLQDLERIHTADEFAIAVYKEIDRFLGTWQRAAHTARNFFKDLGGVELGGVLKLPENQQEHWKTLLMRAVEDLGTQESPKRLLFFWDEMPYMLDSIRQRDGEDVAMEVLDVLRALRQGFGDFRMVLTGSIGLHHVLAGLREADYKNEPLNDMYQVEVLPLARLDAEELARRLVQGEGLATSDPGRTAMTIAELGDCFPFYIHSIVRALRISGRKAEHEDIVDMVNAQLTVANDPWQLGHYRSRIKSYYPKDEKIIAAILDFLATCDRPAPVDTVFSAVKSQATFGDRDRLLDLLKLLQRDHYLARSPEGHYHFRFPLIRRWWSLDRGL